VHLTNAIKVKPNEPAPYINLAFLFRENDPRKAVEYCQTALVVNAHRSVSLVRPDRTWVFSVM